MILFHGSQTGNIKELEPRISLEFVPRVYATDDYAYALVRAGKNLDVLREEYNGLNKPFELAECYPFAFERQFKCDGYIYLLDSDDFVRNEETGEYYSTVPVKPIACTYVPDIFTEMCRQIKRYEFHWFLDQEYWNNVRGGREGFLKRKLERKQKMLEMIKAV